MSEQLFLFAGDDYYPAGGVDDYLATVATPEEAAAELAKLTGIESPDWAHLAAIRDGRLIKVWRWQGGSWAKECVLEWRRLSKTQWHVTRDAERLSRMAELWAKMTDDERQEARQQGA